MKAAAKAVTHAHQDGLRYTSQRMNQRLVSPAIDQERAAFAAKAKRWTVLDAKGQRRWNPARYKEARKEFHATAARLEKHLHEALTIGAKNAQEISLDHFDDSVARAVQKKRTIGGDYEKKRKRAFDRTSKEVGQRVKSASLRFGSPRGQAGTGAILQRDLGADIIAGRPVKHTASNVARYLRGVRHHSEHIGHDADLAVDSVFAVIERIAMRTVRTELAHAYNATSKNVQRETQHETGLKHRIWVTEDGGCEAFCAEMDGQIVGIDDDFVNDDGEDVDAPMHPNCNCSTPPYSEKQGEQDDDTEAQ